MRTSELSRIADVAFLIFKDKKLATGGYARNGMNKAVGLHCSTVEYLDLAGALFLACEEIHKDERDSAFHQSWIAVKQQLGYGATVQKEYVAFLDRKNHTWHLGVLEAIVKGLSPLAVSEANKSVKVPSSSAKATRIEQEYV